MSLDLCLIWQQRPWNSIKKKEKTNEDGRIELLFSPLSLSEVFNNIQNRNWLVDYIGYPT